MKIKQELYNGCLDFIDSRLQTIKNKISEIQESLLSETKSSAGDKHETGRAMLQLEREKVGQQLAEINKIKLTLSKITIEENSNNVIGLGSIVYTSKANYFLAISAGELRTRNDIFYAISPTTPIGRLLLGKSEEDSIAFNENEFRIVKVI